MLATVAMRRQSAINRLRHSRDFRFCGVHLGPRYACVVRTRLQPFVKVGAPVFHQATDLHITDAVTSVGAPDLQRVWGNAKICSGLAIGEKFSSCHDPPFGLLTLLPGMGTGHGGIMLNDVDAALQLSR